MFRRPLVPKHSPRLVAIAAAILVYFTASGTEIAVIDTIRPTEIELTWISDAILATAFGAAIYLWLHLRSSRLALSRLEREPQVRRRSSSPTALRKPSTNRNSQRRRSFPRIVRSLPRSRTADTICDALMASTAPANLPQGTDWQDDRTVVVFVMEG